MGAISGSGSDVRGTTMTSPFSTFLVLALVYGGVSGNWYPVPKPYPTEGVGRGPTSDERYHPGHVRHPALQDHYPGQQVPVLPHHGSGGGYPHHDPYPSYPPPLINRHHPKLGVSGIFGDLSPDQVRALTRFVSTICRMCKYRGHQDDDYDDRYEDDFGDDHDNDQYGDHDDYYGDHDDYYGDHDDQYHYFARSLFGDAAAATNDTNEEGGSATKATLDEEKDVGQGLNYPDDDQPIPSVSRAKRSADYGYSWPKRNSYSRRRPYYRRRRRPYGFEGHVQDSYFRQNPFYLYSKLAYIEHKLKEKKDKGRHHSNRKSKGHKKGHRRGGSYKGHNKKTSHHGKDDKGHDEKGHEATKGHGKGQHDFHTLDLSSYVAEHKH